MSRKSTGDLGEKLAAEYLRDRGYVVLQTNCRVPGGEIDIVARDGDCLAFVEVRTKRSLDFGMPEESITRAKMARLRTTAGQYLQEHEGLPEAWRIDVVAIELGEHNLPKRIELFQNAVGE